MTATSSAAIAPLLFPSGRGGKERVFKPANLSHCSLLISNRKEGGETFYKPANLSHCSLRTLDPERDMGDSYRCAFMRRCGQLELGVLCFRTNKTAYIKIWTFDIFMFKIQEKMQQYCLIRVSCTKLYYLRLSFQFYSFKKKNGNACRILLEFQKTWCSNFITVVQKSTPYMFKSQSSPLEQGGVKAKAKWWPHTGPLHLWFAFGGALWNSPPILENPPPKPIFK